MNCDLSEVKAVEAAVNQIDSSITELLELELALVGGGTGEVVMV